MRFKFRLQPLVKITERRIKVLKVDLSRVVAERQVLEQMIVQHQLDSEFHDQQLAGVDGGLEATFFYAARRSRQREHSLMLQRLQEFFATEHALEQEIVAANYELYRLEKAKEKAKAQFKADFVKEEDKELDELAILRFKP